MTAVLLEHQGELLADELCTRHAARARGSREQLVRLWIECNRGRFHPYQCHDSNMTYEAHNSAGETAAGTKWGLAEGRVGGTNHAQTYILIANPGAQTATFLRTDGTTIVKTFTIAETSRFNIAVTGPGSSVPELTDESFGAIIESTQPIIVERSLYTDAGGITWAAGTNATATRLA